ncbi:MAG: hypothetical protein Tp178MES00d2C33159091_25 [Prokaryotic dsDNA virus sp.]|uniref:hypothetical protein n=1 Tax=Thalassospira sp. TaxID=1912094 RepID=UPI000C50059A|nr:hypothetical protein [Thalassospira sp.]QDP60974.1 MAG: hypothetical protein Tp178MES00d2C33159091_25 [Prokaryotic dsDNA virus sp.]MAZ33839.1 hypothetical protein [Thalassospira sp.]MAZ33895.1 hypothetical protein [Thalassospira sp.]MAZ34612.1 hypothetical protein [Thalassospira sp.]QDP64521.1 MAG: hypothetical protein Tp178SUR1139111_41 [Prokaryotic dsDNA virus sp.]|tara:strand:+ start:315 stop:620 length:306 start_codon:yes stop_codon:yes gene_type:complete
MDFAEYIPFVVGAGLFVGSIFAGVWKGKKDASEGKASSSETLITSGVLQDNYSMLMMSEQLRTNKDQMEKVVGAMRDLINEMQRLREEVKDTSIVIRDRSK